MGHFTDLLVGVSLEKFVNIEATGVVSCFFSGKDVVGFRSLVSMGFVSNLFHSTVFTIKKFSKVVNHYIKCFKIDFIKQFNLVPVIPKSGLIIVPVT